MQVHPLVGKVIMDIRSKKMIPRSELAKAAGISESWLYKCEMLGSVPKDRIVERVAGSLETTMRKLNNAAVRLEKKGQKAD